MVLLLVVYNKPEDAQAFDRHYRQVHIPLAKALPGVQRYILSRNIVRANESDPFYLVAELDWADMAALQQAFQSKEGAAIQRDLTENIARLSPNVRSMIYEVEPVV